MGIRVIPTEIKWQIVTGNRSNNSRVSGVFACRVGAEMRRRQTPYMSASRPFEGFFTDEKRFLTLAIFKALSVLFLLFLCSAIKSRKEKYKFDDSVSAAKVHHHYTSFPMHLNREITKQTIIDATGIFFVFFFFCFRFGGEKKIISETSERVKEEIELSIEK